jgi:hypothetical protein
MDKYSASQFVRDLADLRSSGTFCICSTCGFHEDANRISFFPIDSLTTFGEVVSSCDKQECLEKAYEVIDAKKRVYLKFSLKSNKVRVPRSSGDVEDGFLVMSLSFSHRYEKFVVNTSKNFISKLMFPCDLVAHNPNTSLVLQQNRFVDQDLIDRINEEVGSVLFSL